MNKKVQNSHIAICGIVKDCSRNLKQNLDIINKIEKKSLSTIVYIYENDSIDNTKEILTKWGGNRSNIHLSLNNTNLKKKGTIPSENEVSCNPYFSAKRINRMVDLRNNYMRFIHSLNKPIDYLFIIDLDVSFIDFDGILSSFEVPNKWDAITANGISRGPFLKYRYHDGYALTEIGMEHSSQTEKDIFTNRTKWTLSKRSPLVPVYSAFGGLAIIRYEIVKDAYYELLYNYDERVEVKCEHFSLFHQINQKGGRVFINPNMTIKYQRYLDLYKTAVGRIRKNKQSK